MLLFNRKVIDPGSICQHPLFTFLLSSSFLQLLASVSLRRVSVLLALTHPVTLCLKMGQTSMETKPLETNNAIMLTHRVVTYHLSSFHFFSCVVPSGKPMKISGSSSLLYNEFIGECRTVDLPLVGVGISIELKSDTFSSRACLIRSFLPFLQCTTSLKFV